MATLLYFYKLKQGKKTVSGNVRAEDREHAKQQIETAHPDADITTLQLSEGRTQ